MNAEVKKLDRSEHQLTLPCVIHSDKVNVRSGQSPDKRTGEIRNWQIRELELWVSFPGEPFPQKIIMQLSNNQTYTSGEYQLVLDDALFVGQFNRISLNTRNLKLIPAK